MKTTQDEIIPDAEQLRQDVDRAEVALDNRNEMIRLMGQYGFLIPAKRLPFWRPTVRSSGDIDGVREALTIIATDGLLAYFLTFEDEVWCGHIQHFSGKVQPLFSFHSGNGSKPSKSRVKQKSRRQQILDSI